MTIENVMEPQAWREAWDARRRQLEELGRKARERDNKGPRIHGDFPAELVGTKCPQSGIILTNKRDYERELDRRGLCSISPSEFKRQLEAQGMGE